MLIQKKICLFIFSFILTLSPVNGVQSYSLDFELIRSNATDIYGIYSVDAWSSHSFEWHETVPPGGHNYITGRITDPSNNPIFPTPAFPFKSSFDLLGNGNKEFSIEFSEGSRGYQGGFGLDNTGEIASLWGASLNIQFPETISQIELTFLGSSENGYGSNFSSSYVTAESIERFQESETGFINIDVTESAFNELDLYGFPFEIANITFIIPESSTALFLSLSLALIILPRNRSKKY